ncbi:hypothetical protein TWF703_009759 [Orbilia oligospora]|uniref:LysM domain-containing protein n=1 Tax=Orbilia oligospora TaxID=2813651 RepID=A0A7C8NRB8_ORBOL|nr:hypothetical protein TWF703_009759 [Orbilia oligospora]
MKVTFALVLLSQALSLVSGTRCNADNCARQVTGDRTTKKVATKTVKKTVTKTVGKVTTRTVGKVVTKTIPKVVTSHTTRIVRITSGTTTITVTPPVASVTKRDLGLEKEHENMDMLETRNEHENMDILEARGYNYPPKVQPGVVKNCVGWRYIQGNDNCDNIVSRFSKAPIALTKANLLKWNPALKNGSGLRKGYWVCVRIDNMPSYISACNAQRYTSACSCWGIKPGTKTICSKTTTKTATRTSTSTCTRTSTSTKTKTTTGTVTKTSTSTKTVTSTSTKVIVVDKTSVIPASTATVTSLPDGHIVCGGQAVNPFNNDNHCGKCNVACSTYCQAGACAGCTATTSICEDGGGHLCDDDSTCICTLNAEGQRACVVSSNCEGAVCSKSSDCPSGWTCVPGTCCGKVCMRAPSGCPNGLHVKKIFKREPFPSGTISKRRILVPEFDLSWKLARMKNKV